MAFAYSCSICSVEAHYQAKNGFPKREQVKNSVTLRIRITARSY